MQKRLFVVVAVVVFLSFVQVSTYAGGVRVDLIPSQYNLTFDDVMKLAGDKSLVMKCLDLDVSAQKYASDGTGCGISGQGTLDRWWGTRTFQVYIPYQCDTLSKPARTTTLKWYSSLSQEAGRGQKFSVESRIGVDHIHASLYRDGVMSRSGNYYLKVVPKVSEHSVSVAKKVGEAEKLIDAFAQGTSAEVLFQIADMYSVSSRNGVKVGGDAVGVESSSESTYANTTTRAIRVGVKDDGRSLMFPAQQKVRVVTITEKLVVDKRGRATKSISMDKSEELLLTVRKVRPSSKGEYRW